MFVSFERRCFLIDTEGKKITSQKHIESLEIRIEFIETSSKAWLISAAKDIF